MKSRGFIPLIVIAVASLLSALTAGGAYMAHKVNQLEKENESIKTELQEQRTATERVVETEAIGTTTISIETSTNTVENLPDESEKVSVTDAIKAPEENFAQVVKLSIEDRLEYNQEIVNYADETLKYTDSAISRMINTKNVAERLDADGVVGEFTEHLVRMYKSDIEYMEVIRDGIWGYRQLVEGDTAQYASIESQLNPFVSRNEAIELIKKISDLSGQKKVTNGISEQYRYLIEHRKEMDAKYEEGFDAMEDYLGRASAEVMTYTPPPMPVVQMPKTSHTYCNVSGMYGESISCESYSF